MRLDAAAAAGARALPLDRRGDPRPTASAAPGAGTTRRCCDAILPTLARRPARRGLRARPGASSFRRRRVDLAGHGERRARHRRPAGDGAGPLKTRMLRLTWEQFDRLEQLTLKRHAASISGVLARDLAGADRAAAGSLAGVRRGGGAAGTQARPDAMPRDLARYASLWCIWGPAFDGKPAFAWAAEILADAAARLGAEAAPARPSHPRGAAAAPARPTAARRPGAAPPLTHRAVRSALAGGRRRHRPGSPRRARCFRRSSGPGQALKACDIGSIDMMVAEAEGLQEYRHAPNGWQRSRRRQARRSADPAGRTRPKTPVALAVASHALRARPAGAPQPASSTPSPSAIRAFIRKSSTSARRDGSRGRAATRRASASRSTLRPRCRWKPAPAAPGIAAPDALRSADRARSPAAACATPARRSATSRWRCASTRPRSGSPRFVIRPGTPMVWPAPPAEAGRRRSRPAGSRRTARRPTPAAWQRSWRGLQAPSAPAWSGSTTNGRGSSTSKASRLEVEASPLVGQAGVTWGWRRTSASTVVMRTEGALDLLALSLELRLSGELVDGPRAIAHPCPLQGPQRAAHDDRPARRARRRRART